MKTCFKCNKEKPLRDFYAHPSMRDGHLGKCKLCCQTYEKTKRLIDPSVRERDNKRSNDPVRQALRRLNSAKWILNNPDGYKAHNAVSNAVRDGKITRGACEVCGGKAHAHHDDYARPLDVRWLCALHHQRHHAALRNNQ